MQEILQQIDNLKTELDKVRHLQSYKIADALDIEYTYESNKIEGNTLTLQETKLVIEKGLTISGKPLKEHLEATNHQFAIDFIRELVQSHTNISEQIVKQIHQLILQGIDNTNAGKYRTQQVLISGSKHIPPPPYTVNQKMEEFLVWYSVNKSRLHPVTLSALMHLQLVTIHPFIDGNGRTARLLMNLILLQHGYTIAILKGNTESRLEYYQKLEQAQTQNQEQPFIELIANNVKNTMSRILNNLK